MASHKMRDNYQSLSGPEKAAVVFLILGEEQGSKLMERLDEEEIRNVSRAMSSLGNITATLLESVLRNFTEKFSKGGAVVGSHETAERMLGKFMAADRVKEIMNEISGPTGRSMWEKISNISENVLADYLKNEYPQTVAAVMSKLKPENTSRILTLLPQNLQVEVITRMISIEPPQRDILSDIENTLHTEFLVNFNRTTVYDAHAIVADIFNRTDPEAVERLFAELEKTDPDAVKSIKNKMFTFEDLTRLDQNSLSQVIRAIEGDQLPIALKGAPPNVRDIFLGCLSERAKAMLMDEIAQMRPLKMKDVQEAQTAIVQVAKTLAENNVIVLPTGEDEGMVI
jgi:flagellar motor switch protein FliG